jgi:hypothetical protein
MLIICYLYKHPSLTIYFFWLLFCLKGVKHMKPPKNVDEYIAQAPKEVQAKLQELRTNSLFKT